MISIYARIAALAAVLVLLAGIGWRIDQGGYKRAKAEWNAEKLATSENARLREQAAQKSTEKVDREYQTAKNRLAADKRVSDDRLRDFQAVISADTATSAAGRTHGTGGLERELLGSCAEALTSMGQTADRLEGKIVGLQSYINNVCQAK